MGKLSDKTLITSLLDDDTVVAIQNNGKAIIQIKWSDLKTMIQDIEISPIKSASYSKSTKKITLTREDDTTLEIGGDDVGVEVIDNLTSDSAIKVLSAKQGKALKDLIGGKVDKVTGKELINTNILTSDKTKVKADKIEGLPSGKVVYAGASSSHGRQGTTWATMPFNSHHINPNAEYVEIISGNTLKIKKAGYYSFTGNIMKHKNNVNGWGHSRILKNGSAMTYTYERHYFNGSWMSAPQEYHGYFNVGDTLQLSLYQAGSNPYNYHAHGYHSRMYLIYLGK